MAVRSDRSREQEQHEAEAETEAQPQAPAAAGPQFTARGAIPPVDLGGVRAHAGPSASERGYGALGALAYTRGSDIHVGPGQERHLPHEAWHVTQQAQGRVRPTAQINEDEGLEREADEQGARVTR